MGTSCCAERSDRSKAAKDPKSSNVLDKKQITDSQTHNSNNDNKEKF